MNRYHSSLRRGLALAAALTLAAAPAAFAENETGGAPGSWLSQYSGARTLGLGGSFVGTADDASAMLWNPAGLSQLVPNEFRFETARLFEDTAIHSLGFAVPGNRLPSFGLNIVALRSGQFEKTNEMNDPLGTFSEGETAYLFTMSKAFSPRFSLGSNVKVVHQSVEDFSATGLGFDVGGIAEIMPSVRVGASILNLSGPSLKLRDTAEKFPMEIRGGFSAAVLHGRGLLTAELDQSNGDGLRLHGGSEYWIQPEFALRVGMNDGRGAGGMSYRYGPHYQIDYAVSDHPLGLTHRIGVSYRFGGFFAHAKADPPVFSPTGEIAVTKILLNARTKADTDSWTLALRNKTDEVVRRFGGKGTPPAHLLWDGKDETGLPLPDGVYRYELVVKDAEGREITSPTRTVEISTGGPQGSVPVIPVQ
jgi:hypothetical protein